MPLYGDGRSGTFSATVTQFGGYKNPATPTVQPSPGQSRPLSQPSNPPIATLTDDFATTDATKWGYAAAATATGGQLVETPNASYSGYVYSADAYDLTASSATVELVQNANLGNSTISALFDVYLNPADPNQDEFRFDVTGGALTASRAVAYSRTTVASTAYDATAHRWLRIREAGGAVYWDTSADGATWANLGSWVPTFGTGALHAALGSGYYGTEPSPGTVIWDNFNTAPPASTSAAVTDSATGTDALTTSAQVPVVDAASASDAVAVAAASTLTDTAAASDAASVTVRVPVTDTGAAVDAVAVAATAPLPDTAGATDVLAVATSATIADTASASDTITARVAVAITDSATSSDALSVSVPVTLTDTGSAIDVMTVTAGVPTSDAGAAVEALTAAVRVPLADTAAASDAVATTGSANPALADTATSTDAVTVATGATLNDAGAGGDSLTAAARTPLADSGTAVDAITVTVGGVDTYHPHVYVTATLAGNGVGTADLASNGTGSAIVGYATVGGFGLDFGESFGGPTLTGPATATLTYTPSTAVLTGNGVSTATLASNGVSTATVTEVPALAELQLV